MKLKLTKSTVDRRCLPPEPGEVNGKGKPLRQKLYWDTEVPGFGVVVSAACKTFVVQRSVGGKTVRVSIGQLGVYTVDEAQKKARRLLQDMRDGINPNARRREVAEAEVVAIRDGEWRTFTLQQAIEEHIANMKAENRSPRSIKGMQYEMERYLGEWLDRSLVDIRRADCLDRHRKITEGHGPVAANRALRYLRACWNSARARYDELPEHPLTRAIGGRRFPWNRMKRKRQPVQWKDLPAWAATVDAIKNPIRRDWQWFVLLTGLRSEDARTVRWEHVDFDAGSLHRPSPKGGEDRAFTIPLSSHVLRFLKQRRENNPLDFGHDDRGWAWPTWSREGRVTYMREPKVQEYYKDESGTRRKRTVLPSPHRLRDTFASAANEAGVGLIEIKILMNHVLPEGDVTEGYIRPSDEHLRKSQELVTAFLLQRAGVAVSAGRIRHVARRQASA